MSAVIRPGEFDDLPSVREIFNDLVRNSTAIWMEQEDDLASFQDWLKEKRKKNTPLFVAVENDEVVGFTTYGAWRSSGCYKLTVEHSVHVHRDHRKKGIGKSLLNRIIDTARADGKHAMIGAVTADNVPSIKLHEKLGFFESARMREVGYKFGRWLDLVFMQKQL